MVRYLQEQIGARHRYLMTAARANPNDKVRLREFRRACQMVNIDPDTGAMPHAVDQNLITLFAHEEHVLEQIALLHKRIPFDLTKQIQEVLEAHVQLERAKDRTKVRVSPTALLLAQVLIAAGEVEHTNNAVHRVWDLRWLANHASWPRLNLIEGPHNTLDTLAERRDVIGEQVYGATRNILLGLEQNGYLRTIIERGREGKVTPEEWAALRRMRETSANGGAPPTGTTSVPLETSEPKARSSPASGKSTFQALFLTAA
jgi:hypothetical protein